MEQTTGTFDNQIKNHPKEYLKSETPAKCAGVGIVR
jgi:hypothetical protein